jgi:hypothetical protein
MSLSRTFFLTAATLALTAALAAPSSDAPRPAHEKDQPPKAVPAPKVKKKMKMDEPMEGGMKKPGMMKGDVKKAAEKKDQEMKLEK